ncbi:MAG TPA: pectate lyase [Steroidobacteraceae bacterium]|nr:pectate lyase [Steroidobacteraceae bacterium]
MRVKPGLAVLFVFFAGAAPHARAADAPTRADVQAAMKRATQFMVDKVSYRGGYLWNYLPDMSRRWGEMEARETMIWLQPPGTSSMGHEFLDAYHATGDEYYYRAAEQVGAALIWGQHPSGGWNYVVDFAGDRSLRDWYDTVGRNAWRLEEFQHYYGNATFDDQVSTDAATFLLRLYTEKLDPRYKAAVDRAIEFVLDSQYPIGAWPQRYPLSHEFSKHGLADYSSYYTFNDDVAWENVSFLIQCYQVLGDARLLDPILRGMNFFLLAQQGAPSPAWALQYTPDLKPAAARTYEPLALATHTTAANINHLITFYELTGDTRFLARVPEAIDWLERVKLPRPAAGGRTHPTFIEPGTNRPLYVHRRGSNVVNGEYYVDYDPQRPIGHYSPTRRIDTAALRKRYENARNANAQALAKASPLTPGAGVVELPRFFAERYAPPANQDLDTQVRASLAALNDTGFWPAPLPQTSHPYRGPGSRTVAPGDFAATYVGDDSDTSPYPDTAKTPAISTQEYLRNMNILVRSLSREGRRYVPEDPTAGEAR